MSDIMEYAQSASNYLTGITLASAGVVVSSETLCKKSFTFDAFYQAIGHRNLSAT